MGCCGSFCNDFIANKCKEDKKKNIKDKGITQGQKAKKKIIERKKIEINKKRNNEIDEKKLKGLINDDKMNFNQLALEQNNKYRKKHQVGLLELDEYLYERAFILAKQYLIDGTFDNKNLLYKEGQDLGMNILLIEKKLDPKNLMKIWYDEGKDYNFFEQKELESSNFTQMIWKNSTNFGVGYFCLPEEEEEEKEKKVQENNKNENKKISRNNNKKKQKNNDVIKANNKTKDGENEEIDVNKKVKNENKDVKEDKTKTKDQNIDKSKDENIDKVKDNTKIIDKDNNNARKNFAENQKKTYYYVALYYPAGNIPGKYNENVLQEPVIKNEENDEEEISQKDNEDETEKAGLGNNKDNDFNKKETDSKEKNNKGKNHEKEGKKENEENNLINGGDDENDYQISEKDNGIEHKV